MAGARRKTLDVFRDDSGEWRWTLTRSGNIIASATEGYKDRESVDANILSALAINLKLVDWTEEDRVVSRGTVHRAVLAPAPLGNLGPTAAHVTREIVHVTNWKRK